MYNSNGSVVHLKLDQVLNEDIRISSAGKQAEDSSAKRGVKLNQVLNDKIEFNTGGIGKGNSRTLTSWL